MEILDDCRPQMEFGHFIGTLQPHNSVALIAALNATFIGNRAEGARLRSGRAKLRSLDFALGSCLECAACLGIAWIKGFMEKNEMSDPMKG
jgi:hypothetical protein